LPFLVLFLQARLRWTRLRLVLWPTPTSRKKVQQFLGFANFYRQFIRGFSSIAAPLHALTSPRVRFVWSPEAESSFHKLKRRFTSAPILTLPDPQRKFVVEVDASNDGVGAVLSQRSAAGKMYPCAYLSRRLTLAECNYDVGNRELLAVKVALEEWRHWLEGAQHPFIVWTDHKNLEYIRQAKRLNSRQARWTLFFNRFLFTLSYRPGSQNIKPDALSRLYDPEPVAKEPEPILPLNRVVGAVSWQIEDQVRRANGGAPPPEGCPENRLFVPVGLRPQVVHWAHTSLLTCHPGVHRTLFVISQRFWWPAMRSGSTWRHAWSAPEIRHPRACGWGSCNPFRSPPDRGQTSPWTLSWGSRYPRATPQC